MSKPRAKIIRIERTSQAWICIEERLPESGETVLLSTFDEYSHEEVVIRAMHAASKTLPADEWTHPDSGVAEYDPEQGQSWLAQGWYEQSENHRSGIQITSFPMAWQPLPKPYLRAMRDLHAQHVKAMNKK